MRKPRTARYSTVVFVLSAVLLYGKYASAQVISSSDARPWFKADLHTHHTFHEPLETVVARYRDTGYKFLVLSTKDTMQVIRYEKESTPDMLVISGVEQSFLTKKDQLGHVIAFPIKAPYPITSSWTLKQGYEKLRAKNKNVILGINHPHDGRWTLDDVLESAAAGVVLFELNSSNMKHGEFETGLWDAALTKGARLYATLTNDVHQLEDVDAYGYIRVHAASLDADAILDAIRNGDFYAEESGCGIVPDRYELITDNGVSRLIVSAPDAGEIRVIADNGAVRVSAQSDTLEYTIGPSDTYVRAEILNPFSRRIFLQPFFLKKQ